MSFTLIMKLSISFWILSMASEGILVVKEYCYLCYRGRYCEAPLRWYCFSILLRNLRFYWVVLGEVSNDIYLILCFIYVSHPSTHFYFKTINKAKKLTINYRFEDQATQRLFFKAWSSECFDFKKRNLYHLHIRNLSQQFHQQPIRYPSHQGTLLAPCVPLSIFCTVIGCPL